MRNSLAFVACVLIWGSTWYGIELQIGVVPLAWSVAYRFLLAALLLFVFCLVTKKSLRFNKQDHLWFAAIGLCLFSLNYVLVYNSAFYLTSGLVAVGFSLLSLFNIFNSRLFLGHKIEKVSMLSAGLGVIGLGLIFNKEIEAFSIADAGAVGLLFCLGSTFIASLGNTIAASPKARNLPLLPFNAWGMAYGTLFNIIFALVQGQAPAFDPRPSYWYALIFLSVFGTVIAFTVYLWLIDRIGVARAAYVAVVMPLVALVISTVLEGFIWTPAALLGVLCILTGNVLLSRSRQKAQLVTEN